MDLAKGFFWGSGVLPVVTPGTAAVAIQCPLSDLQTGLLSAAELAPYL